VRLVGVTFFALAAYLAVESIRDLISQARPGQSPAGIAVTSAALLVMPSLAVAERRTGKALGRRTLIADAAESASAPSLPQPRSLPSDSAPGSAGGGWQPR
jgi:divalent metal cation (Fe/Co/Zn/Cd) transporter